MGQIGAIPGVFPFLRPFPVLEISTGATNRNQGQYAFSVSGVNPEQVYDVSGEAHGEAAGVSRVFRPSPRTTSTTRRISTSTSAATRPRCTGSPRRGSWRSCETPTRRTTSTSSRSRGPVPGDPGGRGCRTRRSPRTSRCCTSSPMTDGTSCRSPRWSSGRRPSARRR